MFNEPEQEQTLGFMAQDDQVLRRPEERRIGRIEVLQGSQLPNVVPIEPLLAGEPSVLAKFPLAWPARHFGQYNLVLLVQFAVAVFGDKDTNLLFNAARPGFGS